MVLHCCSNTTMQGQNSVGKQSRVEVLSQSLLNSVSPAVCEIIEGADADCLNQSGNLDKNVELEIVQPQFSGKDEDGRVHEESTLDANIMDSSNTWGDFEGFSEVKLDNLHNTESLQKLNEKQTCNTTQTDNNPTSCRQIFSNAEDNGRDHFATVPVKDVLSSEDIIKQSFPEIPVPLFLEKISTLEQVLYIKQEDAEIPESSKNQLCADPKNLWKTLTQPRISSSLRRPWHESHYQANLLAVLGIDSHQKALQESKDDPPEKTDFRENEDSSVDKFNISTCKALIQTKLSVSPRQSHLFSYNLFFKKTSSHGNMQYITVPQKKRLFTTQSLRMKMFNSNVC